MKNEVRKVDFLSEEEEKIYILSKSKALEILKKEGISESEQMLNKWCRDGDIDSVRISKGAPKNRGLRISQRSLEAFITRKQGRTEELLAQVEERDAEIELLKSQLKEARREIRELKEKGVVVEKEKKISLENLLLSVDSAEVSFTYKRAKHTVLFDISTNEIIQISKNTRGKGMIDVTQDFTEDEKKAILEAREKEMKKG
ncbi:hypothetical protein F8161_18900 [Bacillus cereus]|uniref:hypothetical protein n=1 Tax=Bacillus cereus group TaxID=86661 RepID=UPI00124D3B75|nr:hypothetical protein [Bacillus cereus]KAB2458503.1 hypothetical protein F8161_18900 [Bacillus cereus]KAB2478599.1 hypothetical protein F8159_15735 [Bacillus cereus]